MWFCLCVAAAAGGVSRHGQQLITAASVQLQKLIQTAKSISVSSGDTDAVTALTGSVWSLSHTMFLPSVRRDHQQPPSY